MKKLLAIAIMIVMLLLLAIAFVYFQSNAIINKKYDIALVEVRVPHDAISIAAGKKIALTRGCYGCHNDSLSGAYYPYWETGMVAANISKKLPLFTDSELYRLLRHGIKQDGTGLWSMPVGMFVNLTDRDILQLMAHLRTVPPVEKDLPYPAFSFAGRRKIIRKEIISEVSLAQQAVKKMKHLQNPTVVQQGQYLVQTTCTECHGYDLNGAYGSPPLLIAKAYQEEQFVKFMQTGNALGNRELVLMSEICRTRFIHYSKDELKSIYSFLMQLEK